MRTICLSSQKGGVGKSTTAHALAAGLSRQGLRILLIDTDPQQNLSGTLKADPASGGTYELLQRIKSIQDVTLSGGPFDIIPANTALSGIDLELSSTTGKEFRLKESLSAVETKYDYTIIDTPPALGILTVNALTASDEVIIPAQADVYSLQGILQLHETIEAVRQYCNSSLLIRGILLTRYAQRTIISRDLRDTIQDTAESMKTTVFNTTIRETIAVKEAQAQQMDIFTYAPKCNASIDYSTFIEELRGM